MKGVEFPGGSVGYGSGIVTAVALAAAVVHIQSLAQEILHATGMAKKNEGGAICKWKHRDTTPYLLEWPKSIQTTMYRIYKQQEDIVKNRES